MFTTKEIRQSKDQHVTCRAQYDQRQESVARDAAAIAATYACVISEAASAVSVLDALAALASYSAARPSTRPVFTDVARNGAGIILQRARHPCVELQEGVDYVPNNYNLIFGESSFLLITGPNSEY